MTGPHVAAGKERTQGMGRGADRNPDAAIGVGLGSIVIDGGIVGTLRKGLLGMVIENGMDMAIGGLRMMMSDGDILAGPISALPIAEEKGLELEEEKRLEEEVRKRLDDFVASGRFDKRLAVAREKEKDRALDRAILEVMAEKRRLVAEFKSKLDEQQRSSEELERIMEDNARRAKEEQQRLVAEAATRREERLRELKKIEMEWDRRKRVEEL
ncbi:hypothetical protein FOZ63_004254 [Perkinsus olseni]|uniref:Uncharacterized protein n=1 Tax=Perkinsus olseni TaxID=32597 RepID=A0A7J6RLD7_PEROL|nr:hypothetical protein FOZ63_004254 [Perkinsus olseni]